uniref:Protein ENHANCED DISEASE RESISTANCE 2 C-terminal domain-containing protein n=1 Tax=Entomoneis paludosa TaxID=265537 RepID=A0A7S2YC98_9STRA
MANGAPDNGPSKKNPLANMTHATGKAMGSAGKAVGNAGKKVGKVFQKNNFTHQTKNDAIENGNSPESTAADTSHHDPLTAQTRPNSSEHNHGEPHDSTTTEANRPSASGPASAKVHASPTESSAIHSTRSDLGDNFDSYPWITLYLWMLSLAVAAQFTYTHRDVVGPVLQQQCQSVWAAVDLEESSPEEIQVIPNGVWMAWLVVAYLTGQVVSLPQLWQLTCLIVWTLPRQCFRPSHKIDPCEPTILEHVSRILTGPSSLARSQHGASVVANGMASRKASLHHTTITNAQHDHQERRSPLRWMKRKTRGIQRLVFRNTPDDPDNDVMENALANGCATTTETAATTTMTLANRQPAQRSYMNHHAGSQTQSTDKPKWLQRLDLARGDHFSGRNNLLMSRLLKNPDYLKKRRQQNAATNANDNDNNTTTAVDPSSSPLTDDTSELGKVTGTGGPETANSFQDVALWVVQPVLQVRGMDIFMTDDPAFDVSNHPWFLKQGLRDTPTFLINGVTQWGNILVYFALPEWVHDLQESLQETDQDPTDVRALKRFLKESDDYRNERLKFIPAVVDGPMAVRVLAPPKKERVIHGQVIPITWHLYDREVNPKTGQVLHPVVSASMDCLSSGAVRNLAGLVKKYLVTMTLDLALVIGAPSTLEAHQKNKRKGNNNVHDDTDNEPKACLGLFRFEHVDVNTCPAFPEFVDKLQEEEHDLKRASVAMGISKEELQELQRDLKEQHMKDHGTSQAALGTDQ